MNLFEIVVKNLKMYYIYEISVLKMFFFLHFVILNLSLGKTNDLYIPSVRIEFFFLNDPN